MYLGQMRVADSCANGTSATIATTEGNIDVTLRLRRKVKVTSPTIDGRKLTQKTATRLWNRDKNKPWYHRDKVAATA